VATFRHLPCEPPEIISQNEFVALDTIMVLLPNAFVFLAPAAHQIRAHKDIAPAFITRDIMTSVDIE
jgi:hypothetical protein